MNARGKRDLGGGLEGFKLGVFLSFWYSLPPLLRRCCRNRNRNRNRRHLLHQVRNLTFRTTLVSYSSLVWD